jgi:predicted DNA-binding transcriptional regulator AlpA
VGPRIVRYHETDVEEFLKRRTDNPPDEDHP